MARAFWSGSLGFGLVNVPVALYSATRDKMVHFNQFERGTTSRIRYRRVNEDTGDEVGYDDIVKGHDVGDGEYVIVTPEELEGIEPTRSRTIDISDFVRIDDIDPIYYQKTYYLAPQSEQAERAYSLLRQAMEASGKIAIATFVMRTKQYLAAIRPKPDVLALDTMFFADEVRDPVEEIEQLPTSTTTHKGRDLDMAVQLIESMTTVWDPHDYRDIYRDRVLELIDAKRHGDQVVTQQPAAQAGEVVDLMAALRASLAAARTHTPGNAGRASTLQRRPGGDDGAGSPGALQQMTKKELYQLAQEHDIPGRSTMTREQLVEAVRAGEPPRKQAS